MGGAGRWQSRTEVGKSEEVSLTSKPRKPSMTSCWSGALKRMFLDLQKGMLFSHSVVSNSAPPWTAACQASLSFTISQILLKLISMESVMPSNHLIFSCPLLLLPSIFPSIRVFSNELALRIRWPKYRSFNFTIRPSNDHSELISFRINWCDLLAVQGTFNRLLQHHSSSINSLAFRLLYGPTLTSIHDYWKNHSFDYTDLCQQINVSSF